MNEQRKLQFIEETFQGGEFEEAKMCFKQISNFEDRWGADIAERPSPDVDMAIREAAKRLCNIHGGDEVRARISIAKTLFLYNKWCRKNKLAADPNITRSNYIKIAKAATWVLDSPDALQRALDRVLMPVSTRSTDLYCRGIIWLAYAGLSMEEIASAVADEFDVRTSTISVYRDGERKTIKIPELGTACLTVLASTDNFIDYSDVLRGPITVPRREGNMLVRTQTAKRAVKNWESRNKKTFVRNAINVVQGKTSNLSITYDTLYKNGFYYRAWYDECLLPEERRLEFAIPSDPSYLVKMNYRIYIDELEKLVNHFMENVDETADCKKARRYWRHKIYNEYLLWKWVSGNR